MRAPAFWSKNANPVPGLLLAPLGWLYGLGTGLRLSFSSGWSSPCPIICVGNLTAGGAGKTPVVMNLAARLPTAHVLSRGYGGWEAGPLKVMPGEHTASQVGDEPLLISNAAPTWVAGNREAGCRAALRDGAGIIILDDGFQDPSIVKNLSLVVVDGEFGFGNGHLIPAGPLRETVSKGLARADAVVIIGEDTTGITDQVAGRCPVLKAMLVPEKSETSNTSGNWHGKKVLAFAGIGRPEKFFQTLRDLGCDISESVPFADHQPYSETVLNDLKQRAVASNATLVTTEKDLVRIPEKLRQGIEAIRVKLQWDDESQINALLEKHQIR